MRPGGEAQGVAGAYSARMRAYKFTAAGGVGFFTGFAWPLPAGGAPGGWVDAHARRTCVQGVHACRVPQLPYWLGPELWELELDGAVTESAYKVVADRGRLVRRVEGWPQLERPFAQECSARTRRLAADALRAAGRREEASRVGAMASTTELMVAAHEAAAQPGLASTLLGYAADCAMDIDKGYYAMCAYVAATAFGNWSTGDTVQDMSSSGWVQERARQATWLARHLGLVEDEG